MIAVAARSPPFGRYRVRIYINGGTAVVAFACTVGCSTCTSTVHISLAASDDIVKGRSGLALTQFNSSKSSSGSA